MPVNSTWFADVKDGDCTADAELMIDDMFLIYQEVQAGKIDVDTLVKQVTDTVNAALRLPTECQDPAALFAVFEDEFLKRFTPANPAACKADLDAIDQSLDKIVKDLQAGNTMSLVADLMMLYGGAKNTPTDCKVSSVRMEYM